MAAKYNRRINLYINGKEVKNQIASIRKAFYKATNELARMTVGSKEYNKQLQKVGQLKGIMDKHNQTVRETSKQWNNAGKAVSKKQGVLSKLMGSAKGLLPAFGFAAIIAGAIKAGKALFNLYNDTAKARREAERLTGLSGKPLADFTAQLQGTAQTFNQDFNEMLVGVNSFSKTMGISLDETLQKVNDGFLTGADSSGEFLDILKEYGPQFKAAGLSADESIALISQQVKTGVYSDKGVDAIKEATLSLREMTPATRDALDNIGIASDNLQQQLSKGTISIFDAIQMVSNRLAELPPQSSEVGTAIADIFKGAGEDAGLQYITMLGTAELSLEKLKEGAGENAKAQEKLLEANTKLRLAWSELMGTGTGTFDAIKATAIDLLANGIAGIAKGIAGVRDWFIELYNESLPVRAYFQYMFAMWKTSITAVKIAFQALWEQLKLGGKLIKAVLTFDLSGIKEAFQDYGKNMKTVVVDNAKKVATTWKDAYNAALNGRIEPVKQYVEVETVTTTPLGEVIPVTPESGQPGQPGTAAIPETMDFIDPRIVAEETYSDTVLEQSQLRQNILDNEQQAAADRAELDLELQQQRKDAYLATLDTIIGVFGEESKIGKAALLAKQAFAIAETVINIAKGIGTSASAAPFPANIPLILGFVGQVAALIGTIKSATKSVKGFAAGGFTNGEKMYVAGEAGTEWIAPNWMTSNPATAPIISSLESFRKNRISLNPDIIPMFAEGGFTTVHEKMSNLNKFKNTPLNGPIDQLQNEILTDLVGRIGNSLDENTQAMKGLIDKKTYIAIESINMGQKNYAKIQNTRGM